MVPKRAPKSVPTPLNGEASVIPARTRTPAIGEAQNAICAQPLSRDQRNNLASPVSLEGAAIAAQTYRQRVEREDVAPGLTPAHDLGARGPDHHRGGARLDELHRLRVAIGPDVGDADHVADLHGWQNGVLAQPI